MSDEVKTDTLPQETKPATKPPLLLDRVKAVEELANGLAGYVQNEFTQFKGALTQLVEVLNAFIKVQKAEEAVQAEIKAARFERDKQRAERDAKMVAQLVDSGVLKAVEAVSEKSIVVGREFDKDGNLLGGGRAQVPFSQFTDDVKPKVLGQGVGFVIEVDTGKFEVTEIYEQSEPKPPQVTETATEPTTTPAAQ